MTPVEASKKKNKSKVWSNLYGDSIYLKPGKSTFAIGDRVRISKYKRKVFDKGYTPNWTEEIFVIDKVLQTKPVTYNIVDLMGEEIKGSFYEQELQKAKQQTFRIEKIIRRDNNKKMALVKWSGYPDKFNSWVSSKDLVDFYYKICIKNKILLFTQFLLYQIKLSLQYYLLYIYPHSLPHQLLVKSLLVLMV